MSGFGHAQNRYLLKILHLTAGLRLATTQDGQRIMTVRTLSELADSYDSLAALDELMTHELTVVCSAAVCPQNMLETQFERTSKLAHRARHFRKIAAELRSSARRTIQEEALFDNAALEAARFPTLSKEARCFVR